MTRDRDNDQDAPGRTRPDPVDTADTVASDPPTAVDEARRRAETVPDNEAWRRAKTVPSDARMATDETLPSDEALATDETVASDAAAPDVTPPATGARARYRAGERFGSFEVLEELGSGGMGVVIAAHDPDLDRKVAIKVLRTEAGGRDARERLLREAQAMAQLSHPNVITVHQVGTREGQVFVVMEYVDGGTLRDWIDAKPRTWREVLEIYTSAGRGLAAAHKAGLVHRDFKPDNVLVRSDGRVLVTDFGLVGTVDPESGTADPVSEARRPTLSSSSSSRLAVELTRTGAVMGTPLYMAPEQHLGERSDARADQFSFCIAFFEALYGERPFEGKTYRKLADSVLRGEPRAPPARSEVPRWIHDVVARGLQRERGERYPDMEALLEALDRDPSARRRRRWIAAGAAAALIGAAGLVIALWPGPGERCKAAGDKLDQVWNEPHRAALRAAWKGKSDQVGHLIAALDRYGALWTRARVAACEATYVRGEQSEQLLDRRMACLDRKLGEMRALITRLQARGAAVAPLAIEAVASLPGFDECRDREALAEVVPPPAGAKTAIEAVFELIARADAHTKLGELDKALTVAKKALERSRKIGYSPLSARAHYVVGFLAVRRGTHAEAERLYREAIRQAAKARAHHLEAVTWLGLIYLVGHVTDRTDHALAMAPAAEAAVARAAGDAALQGRLEGNLGLILMSKGDYRGAREKLERSLKIFNKRFGPDDLDTAVARNNLAMLLEKTGEHKAAYEHLERVLAAREKVMGPKHPAVATALNDMGNSAHSLGDLARAQRHLERALAIREAALGADHARTGHTLNNLAIVLGDMGKVEQAAKHAQRAVEIAERAFGKSHPDLAGPLNTLGNQLRDLGRRKEAWEAFARGMAIIEHAKGREHISIAPMVENLARILAEMGLVDRAVQFIDRAIAVRTRAQGEGHPMTVNAVALRGSFNLQAGRHDAAVTDFKRQRELATKAFGKAHAEVAQAEYNLAVALEGSKALERADAGYRAALAIFEKSAPGHRFVVNSWRGLGDVATARGDLATAQRSYARAVEIAEKTGHSGLGDLLHLLAGSHAKRKMWNKAADALSRAVKVRRAGDKALLALAEFELAKVLWAGKIDRGRAVKLARHARALFAAAGSRAENNVKEVDAWLHKRGGDVQR